MTGSNACPVAACAVLCLLFMQVIFAHTVYSALAGQVRIGVLLDLSGPLSQSGEAAYKSIQFAVEDINLLGGVGGRHIEITVFDTASDGKRMIEGATKLKDQGVVALIGPSAPQNCILLRKFAEKSRIPLVLISGTAPVLTFSGLKTKWIFSTTLNFSSELKALFSVFKRRGYQNLGVIVEAGEFYRELFLWIRGYAPEYGLKIGCAQGFNLNKEDVARKFAFIDRCDPDAALLWANSSAMPLVINSLHGADLPIGISHGLFDPSLLQAGNSTGSELIFVAVPSALAPEGLRRGLSFSARNFLNKWGSELDVLPFGARLYAAQAWDALHVVVMALKSTRGGVGSRKALRSVLEKGIKGYRGVVGKFYFDKRDHSRLDPSSLSVLRFFSGHWGLVH